MPASLHHLRPLLDVVAQVFVELGRRHHAAARRPASPRRPCTSGRLSTLLISALSLSTIGLRRAGRRHDAEPDRRLVARHAGLGDGRHVGQHARSASCPVVPSARTWPASHGRRHRGDGVEHHLHVAADHAVARLAAAAVRHVHDVGAAHGFEQLAGHVIGRAGPGRGVVELARLRLRERDELLQVLRRHRGMHDHAQVGIVDRRHRHEVAHQLVGLVAGSASRCRCGCSTSSAACSRRAPPSRPRRCR